MTYVSTWAGFIFLAVVLDVWSRRVVGWAIGERMTADLVLAALNMALEQRKPTATSQYTAIEFGKRCKEMGVRPSDGNRRRRVRQRDGRELLRQPRMRADRSARTRHRVGGG